MSVNHRQLSIAFLRATSLIPIEVNADKSPRGGFNLGELKTIDKEAVLKRIAEDKEERNLGAIFHDRDVDVDVDSFDPGLRLSLDHFLPPTERVWGRVSKPRSHRTYTLDEPYSRAPYSRQLATVEKLAIGKISYSVELRGGLAEHGMYTVLPGSKIDMGPERNLEKGYLPQGEMIEWAGQFDPSVTGTTIKAKELIDKIRMAQAVAILAPYWTEGTRNEMNLAVAGMLWRIASLTKSITDMEDDEPPDLFRLTEELSATFVGALCDVAGDDPGDRHTRLSSLHKTWRKLDENPEAKITGGKKLAEHIGDAGPEIVSKLYLLLSDNEQLRKFEELCSRFVVWYGEGMLVDLEMVKAGHKTPWMKRQQAENSLGNMRIEIGGEKKAVTKMLFNSPMVQRIHGISMEPGIDELIYPQGPYKLVNQWHGFAIEPHPEPVKASYMAPFIEYLHDIVACGNDDAMNWVISWIAHIFQTPAQKSRTALVLLSQRTGTGKTFLGDVIRSLIGPLHSTAVQSVEHMIGQFNTIIDNKVFVQANEAIHSHKFTAGQTLKSMITDDTVTVEHKYVNRIEKSNYMRLLATSNRINDAIFIDSSVEERRFTVLEVSPKRAGDTEYWETMVAWCANNKPRLMRFFLDWEISRSLISKPFDTAAKHVLQAGNAPTELVWIASRLHSGHILGSDTHEHWFDAYNVAALTKDHVNRNDLHRAEWPDLFTWEALDKDYAHFAKAHGKWPLTALRGIIKSVLPGGEPPLVKRSDVKYRDKDGKQKTERIRHYRLPTKQAIYEHICDVYGAAIVKSLMSRIDEVGEVEETVNHNESAKF